MYASVMYVNVCARVCVCVCVYVLYTAVAVSYEQRTRAREREYEPAMLAMIPLASVINVCCGLFHGDVHEFRVYPVIDS